MKEIGIFGGSFNPIHNGHIMLANCIREKAKLDEIWFMVSPMNPFKQSATDLLNDKLRFELVKGALKEEQSLKACDYELHLPKPSYTWNTLRAISKDYKDARFTLLIGGDNLAAFDKWYNHDSIIENYQVIVYPRQGSEERNVPNWATIIDAPLMNISSTEIRKRISNGDSIHGMVPQCIEKQVLEYYSKTDN